ncbi:MAG: hypothetical protein CMH55_03430 [Myxococcales bacterium]|nr:hypothetical protein [Myxococcales bacterium]
MAGIESGAPVTEAPYQGPERRSGQRQKSLSQRRLAYWREVEDLGREVLTHHGEGLAADLLTLYRQLEDAKVEHADYLEALRKTIEEEERGFKEWENTFLARLEKEHKKREQLLTRIARDQPDAESLGRALRLAKEELAVVKRKIAEEEARAAGEVTPLLKDLRLDAIRRDRAIQRDEERLAAAQQVTSPAMDPRVAQIDEKIRSIQAEVSEAEKSIDGRLEVHQQNLKLYSDALTVLRKETRDHLIKVGDAALASHFSDHEPGLARRYERLVRLVREGAD